MTSMKYFDYAATCPLDEEALEVYVRAATKVYGNSNSLHDIGSAASNLLENCRNEFARMLGVNSEGIYFTSGGSESNFLTIQALLSSALKDGKHIITSATEHSSVQSTLEKLKEKNYEVTILPLNSAGYIDVLRVKDSIREDTVLCCIQHGNPEIGTIQPIKEISLLCKENKILFHSDCVHTFGKVSLLEISQFVDGLSISSHKFYGPKGVGVAYVHPSLNRKSYYPGASHEKGFRPGTLNVPGVAAMTIAAQKAEARLDAAFTHAQKLRDAFLQVLIPIKDTIIIYGSDYKRQIPYTVGMRVEGIEGQYMMLECNRYGFAISTGSACQIQLQSSSKTMKAMGITGKSAKEFIRISFGWDTSDSDVKELAETIVKIVHAATRT